MKYGWQFADLLREKRTALKIKSREAAYDLGIRPQTYSRYESADHMPSLQMIRRISAYFEIPVGTLFEAYMESAPNYNSKRFYREPEIPADAFKTARERTKDYRYR